jgi:amino acid permease
MSDSKGKKRQFVSLPSQDDMTAVERPEVGDSSSASKIGDQHEPDTDAASSSKPPRAFLDLNPVGEHGRLRRGLSARQVQMIAIAGK